MPVSTVFAFLFFFFKFYIEKYNLIFVYLKEYEARGKIKHGIIPIQLFTIVLIQVLNYVFFYANNTDGKYLAVGIPYIVIQLICLILFKVYWEKHKIQRDNKLTAKESSNRLT